MKTKWSKYIFIFPVKNKMIIYNYAWNSAVIVLNELYSILEECKSNPNLISDIHSSLYQDLVRRKIIIEDSICEEEEVIKNIKLRLSDPSTLRITINPTLDCNLRCWYCYESHTEGEYINKTITTSILNFLERSLNKKNLKKVELSFFGGEPLLRAHLNAIPVAKEIKKICEKKKKKLSLHFTSNGVLLSSNIVDELCYLNIPISFQIPFDGNEEIHNKIKFMHNGEGCYSRILKNIDYAIANHISINVRFNYGLETIDSFKEVIDDIMNLPHYNVNYIKISLQRIWQCKNTLELEEKAREINDYSISNGLSTFLSGNVSSNSYCYADYLNSYLFNYNGDVFKCTAREFSEKNRIGILNIDGSISYLISPQKLIKIRFKKECKQCSLLPICTICSQTHFESGNSIPCNISEEDKQGQIERKMKEQLKKYTDYV